MNFIINKEEYLKVKESWKKIIHHDVIDHIFYNSLRGHDLKRGFSPIKSAVKLGTGHQEWQAFDQAKRDARWALRDNGEYGHDTPERKLRREKEQADRYAILSKKYGIVFTPELITTLRELFK